MCTDLLDTIPKRRKKEKGSAFLPRNCALFSSEHEKCLFIPYEVDSAAYNTSYAMIYDGFCQTIDGGKKRERKCILQVKVFC